jgi:RsmE family RNA methyltransferase
MNLILVDRAELAADHSVVLSGARADHIRHVLHASMGDAVRLGVIDGGMGVGTVVSIAEDRVELRCAIDWEVPARPRVDVLLALPRPKVMRRLWAQLAALGVGQVILTNAEKVERDYFDSHVLQEEGYRPLLVEGLQQARDTRVPVVSVHKRLKVLVEDDLDALCPHMRRIVAHPGGEISIARALSTAGEHERVLVAIGPEGGWNDFELDLLDTHGFTRVGMGPRTLATTTACIALLTLVHEAIRRE